MRRPVSSANRQRQPAQIVRPPLLKSQRRRRRICLFLLLALLLGAGGWLSQRLPLRKAALNARQRVSKLFEAAEPVKAAKPPPELRGSIYDRNMEELAVSYRLFSLQANPAELNDRELLAEQLAQLIGADSKELLQRLHSAEPTVELAAGLDARQAEEIDELRLPGIFCRPAEARYYPGHAAAGHLLGFVSEGIGLGGVESLYDAVLQPGDFRRAEAPEADFAGETSLGPRAADLLLTIDLKLQKQIELLLDSYRQQADAAAGYAVVIDPDSGRLLAAVRQPAFDPNYFWRSEGEREDGPLFPHEFSTGLLQSLLAEAAAIEEAGQVGSPPPSAVSPSAHGLSQELLERRWHEFGFDQPVPELLPLDPKTRAPEESGGGLSAADIAVGAAVLLNSGRRVTPWLLKAVHDPDRRRFFSRNMESSAPQRLLPPAAGVQLRRRLLHDSLWGGKDGFLFTNSATAARLTKTGLSEHRLQDLLIAAAPQDMPRLLLALAVDYKRLNPPPPPSADAGQTDSRERLLILGRSLLELLAAHTAEDAPPNSPPPGRNEANLRRFLLSRKLNRPVEDRNYDPAAAETMPNLVGMSLRQGFQRLNLHKLRIKIQGSGMIVAQQPAFGTPLAKIETCELTLEPFPRHEKPAPAAAKSAVQTERKNSARPAGQRDQQNHP